jgi:hypothetical protein
VSYSTLLTLLANIDPALWDFIVPHTPKVRHVVGETLVDRIALNPQPEPPSRAAFVIAAAELTHDAVRAAVTTEMRGGSSSSTIADLIDDWCGTPWPKKWPWPGPGPRREDGPFPDPWDVPIARVVGALIFASMASRLSPGDLKETLTKGADRLTEAALADARG